MADGRASWRIAVGALYCLDASAEAAGVARRNLRSHPNCYVVQASAGAIPLPDASMDFGYTLGVLHHIPDPAAGLRECVRALRPGGTLLVYLYYALDDRAAWFRLLWRITDLSRRAISRLPHRAKLPLTTLIAAFVYWHLARLAAVLERSGLPVRSIPLSYYRRANFYTMRTDALEPRATTLDLECPNRDATTWTSRERALAEPISSARASFSAGACGSAPPAFLPGS